jgi:hypothetical protein
MNAAFGLRAAAGFFAAAAFGAALAGAAAFFAAGLAAGLAAAFFAGAAGDFLAVAIFEPPKRTHGKLRNESHGLILVSFYCSCKSFSKFFHSNKPERACSRHLWRSRVKKMAAET